MRIAFDGAARQREFWYDLGLYVAWHAAAFTRAKHLPSWDSITMKMKPAPAPSATQSVTQSWQEQKGIMAAHRMALAEKGAKTRRVKPSQKGRSRGER